MRFDAQQPAADRWWDSGQEVPAKHMILLARAERMRLYETAFVGFVSLDPGWSAPSADRAVLGARIGLALWTAVRWERASMDPPEVVLRRVLGVVRAAAEREPRG